MDKLSTKCNKKRPNKGFWKLIIQKVSDFFYSIKNFDKMDKRELCHDLIMFSIGFLLSRCHVIFGAHPLGLAFVCCLPVSVWPSLIGVVIGAISLGADGIIFAAISAIAVFLRAAITATEREKVGIKLFSDGLLLRMSVATICGFIGGAYEVLLSGLNEKSLLFGVCMVILTPLLCFVFSGLFYGEVTLRSVIYEQNESLSFSRAKKSGNYGNIIFQLSSLMLIFFIGLSFKGVDILGISITYLYCGVITLLCAKKFGAFRAMAVGFASSLGLSGTLSVAFALAGLGAGAMFGLGAGYAVAVGGIALCAFSAYSSGLSGLLATMPEYIIASAITLPFLKKINITKDETEETQLKEKSEDMVGTMALAYQSKYSGCADMFEESLNEMAKAVRSFCTPPADPSFEDYKDIVIDISKYHCEACTGSGLCASEGIRPCIKNADKIASILLEKKIVLPEDVNTDTEFCQMAKIIAESINRESARVDEKNIHLRTLCNSADKYNVLREMISAARERDALEKSVDNSLNDSLTVLANDCGLSNFTIRAFGERKKRFIIAAEDPSGEKISSNDLRCGIENTTGIKLGKPEFFRKGRMVVMECEARRSLSVKAAFATSSGEEGQVSGDCVMTFESKDDKFFAVISDGMGSGIVARETADFVCKFVKSSADISEAKNGIFHMINHSIREKGEECSASVDWFEVDLITGEAMFVKSGAAPSFVKRESSIFRIRSRTAPLGLMNSIDSEKTKAEIKVGDYIIMISDGVADETDDAPWLLLLLGDTPPKSIQDFADLILSEAKKNSKAKDDMTVVVMKIEEN